MLPETICEFTSESGIFRSAARGCCLFIQRLCIAREPKFQLQLAFISPINTPLPEQFKEGNTKAARSPTHIKLDLWFYGFTAKNLDLRVVERGILQSQAVTLCKFKAAAIERL